MLLSKLAGWMGYGSKLPITADARPPYQRQPGPGHYRALARLKAKREANEAIPHIEREPSRQAQRRSTLLRERQILTIAKAEAKRAKVKGGSAIIRGVADIEPVLG